MKRRLLLGFLCLALALGLGPLTLQTVQAGDGDVMTSETPERSGGSYRLRQSSAGVTPGPYTGQDFPSPLAPVIGNRFDGFNYDHNPTENGGYHFIPPDPIGASGTDRLIAVVNCMIEARSKTGTFLWRDSLKDFFTSLTPANSLFDPKVIYDHYENRFLVVALEQTDTAEGDPSDTSRILLAVSNDDTPDGATTADWWYTTINSKVTIGAFDCWADYPGFEVDEEAVYITANMFDFTIYSFRGVRLWIVNKGTTGGFYAGGAATVTLPLNPYAGSGYATTTMPAQVYGSGGIGGSGGTYLVSFSGINDGVNEYVQVVRVNNPLGAPTFAQEYVSVGNIDNLAGSLPDAPQPDTTTDIEVNDRRALDVVWRNNKLWLTTTINPRAPSPDAGETTAHWFQLNTTAAPGGAITLDQQGNIGGEDIATGTYTYFPSLAVNNNGDAKFGFSASAPTIYAGAYATAHLSGDAAGTVQASETVRAGVDWYVRTFGGTLNRWGDYTGAALDPTDDNVVWLFNQYAMARGSASGGEDGRWGTAWASNLFITPAWDSHTDSARIDPPEDTFGSPNTIVYMKGTGFASGTYNVTYYDATVSGGGSKIFTDAGKSVAGDGVLNVDITLTSYPISIAGLWHALVQPAGATAFPSTYNAAVADPVTYNLIANDSFTVETSSIPEFPTALAGIVALALSAGIYLWMRRKAALVPA